MADEAGRERWRKAVAAAKRATRRRTTTRAKFTDIAGIRIPAAETLPKCSEGDCTACEGYHQQVPRSEVIDTLTSMWVSDEYWFAPAVGRTLLDMVPYMQFGAEALYLDGPETCLQLRGGAMTHIVNRLPRLLPERMVSGIFTIRKDTPRDLLVKSFPGYFGDDDDGVTSATKILLAIAPDATMAAFAPIMLDVIAFADPVTAMEIADKMSPMEE